MTFQPHDFVYWAYGGEDNYGYVQGFVPHTRCVMSVRDIDGEEWHVELSELTLVLRGGSMDAGAEEYEQIIALQDKLNM